MKKIILILGLFVLMLVPSALADNGDTYYFTDTDVNWDATQFSIIVNVLLFMFFFWIGYLSPKRSGGGFMILAGFMLFALEVLLSNILSAFYVVPLVTPIAIYIILLGIRKQFMAPSKEKTKSEGQ